MASGPVVIGYDGSPAADHAIRESGRLLAGRSALVVVVWKAGLGFELMELPTATVGLPPAALDIRTAVEIDQAMAERSQRLAEYGGQLAGESGYAGVKTTAVADDAATPVAETLVEVTRERDGEAIVVGAHGPGRVGEALLGSTSRDVIRHAERPVVVVRGPGGR